MIVNDAAKRLIKKYEGLRLRAYRCSAGKLTIGYGHTSAAGAPDVKPGMVITKAEAEKIFDRDIEKFASGVAALIKVDVTENQFGACVSLAFNIGLGGFAKSSVLRFLNARKLDDAADAFLLWNRATQNGRKVVLPGLTKRRAAEAALFKLGADEDEDDNARVPDAPEGKPALRSTTNIAAGVTAAAGLTAAAKDVVDNTSSIFSSGNLLMIALILVVLGGAAWIVHERWLKARDWGI